MDIQVISLRAMAVKCPRCYQYHMVADNFDHLCDRCCDVLLADYPDHPSVPHIQQAYQEQRIKWSKP